MSKGSKITLAVILACVFAAAAVMLCITLAGYANGNRIYEESRQAVEISAAAQTAEGSGGEDVFPDVSVDFDVLKKANGQVMGWILIPETDISYPLVQGEDNDKYLCQSYDLQYNSSGSIFMDHRCSPDFTGDNTLIYGHNMKNGSMFAGIREYAQQEFFEEHRNFYIFTPEKDYKFTVFAAFRTESDSDVYDLSFTDEAERTAFIAEAEASSDIVSGVEVGPETPIVTLSTCTSDTYSGRYVVLAALTAERER